MEFFVSLILAKDLNAEQFSFLDENATHIVDGWWFFEGDTDTLTEEDIDFDLVEEDMVVEALGGLGQEELIEIAGLSYNEETEEYFY